jgi:hypothetical protein
VCQLAVAAAGRALAKDQEEQLRAQREEYASLLSERVHILARIDKRTEQLAADYLQLSELQEKIAAVPGRTPRHGWPALFRHGVEKAVVRRLYKLTGGRWRHPGSTETLPTAKAQPTLAKCALAERRLLLEDFDSPPEEAPCGAGGKDE